MSMGLREQIEAVRDSGRVNMFNSRGVQVVADAMGLYELVAYIEENRIDYLHFIMSGEGATLEGYPC